MSYVGNTNTTQGFIPAIDYFSGNGSTTAFTLSRPVASVAQVQANISNVPQNPGSAYTVSGNTITFTSAPPSGTNNIYVYYTSPITQVIAPGQGTVNTTSLGNITNIASGNSSLTLQTGTTPTTAMTIDTSQNVGVGVTPSAWDTSIFTTMQIRYASFFSGVTSPGDTWVGQNLYYGSGAYRYIANGYASYYRQSQSQHQWGVAASGTAGNTITFTQAMTLDASGNLALGLTSGTGKFELASGSGSSVIALRIRSSSGNSNGFQIVTDSTTDNIYLNNYYSAAMMFGTNNTERMRIDSSGNLLVGTTSLNYAGSGLTLSGNSGTTKWLVGPTSGTPGNFWIASSGSTGVYLNGTAATSWSSNSDERLKTDLKPIENAAQKVASLRSVTGRYKTDEEGYSRAFLIAQDVMAVLPEAVAPTTLSDGTEVLGLAYTETIPLLVAAIKEQQALIQTLTDRITALENK